MELQEDWKRHYEGWKNKLQQVFYSSIGTIELEGFKTYEQLSLTEAKEKQETGQALPMPKGTKWGELNEYAWLFAKVILPDTFRYPNGVTEHSIKGQRIIMELNPGGESTVFVNGKAIGNRRNDWVTTKHHFMCDLILMESADGKEQYDLVMETLGTSGPRITESLPLLQNEEPFQDDPTPFTEIGRNTYGIWNEEVYQLWLEITALEEIASKQNKGSSRRKAIYQALRKFTTTVDFSDTFEHFLDTVKAARELLKPLMECRNGSSQATMYAFGHSHIDVAWLWTLKETERKCPRTLGAQLSHIKHYPDYIYLQSQPQLYQMTKELYPELYEEVKKAVESGNIVPEGGMWVEADTNLAGGEALIRQFIHGKRFFKEEFGKENELLWLPDVFGYSAALPQIMKGCNIKYFSTCKIFWNYGGGELFPYNYFNWTGIDGSKVTAFIHNDYNSTMNPAAMIDRWEDRRQQDTGINEFLVPFGYGDGGGGPTRDHIEFAKMQKDLEGAPKVEFHSPLDFFHDLEKRGDLPTEEYVGELYFQCHRGTYTSQARVKKGNRKGELALRQAEIAACAAIALTSYEYPYAAADEAWKKLLLNQFHDILPGSSIRPVYETTWRQHEEILATADDIYKESLSCLSAPKENTISVYNPISWTRKELVKLPDTFIGAMTQDNIPLQVQMIDGAAYAEVEIPGLGAINLYNCENPAKAKDKIGVTAAVSFLENDILYVSFNTNGEIDSIVNKANQKELTAGTCNAMKMYQDIPNIFDAWDIDSFYNQYPVELTGDAKIEVVTSGSLVGILKITRTIHNSVLTQYVSLKQGERKLDFTTTIDWKEKQKLLKVCFPVDIHTDKAMNDIQFGYVERPNHFTTQLDKDRFEVVNHKWTALVDQNRGAAVLNDCKYGVNMEHNSINLTLLKAPIAPDKAGDIETHEFTYSLYFWDGPFLQSGLVKEAYALNCPVAIMNGECNFTESLVTTGADNIVVETVKPAEDQSGDIIIRLYEAMNCETMATLTLNLPFEKISLCNMLEEEETPVAYEKNQVTLNFKPFEIKTIRLYY